MRGLTEGTSTNMLNALHDLIERTKAANLAFATQLLQMAQLEILMNERAVAPDEMDALRRVLERQTDSSRVLDLDEVRRSRLPAIRTR
jgi:hypothetical protein